MAEESGGRGGSSSGGGGWGYATVGGGEVRSIAAALDSNAGPGGGGGLSVGSRQCGEPSGPVGSRGSRGGGLRMLEADGLHPSGELGCRVYGWGGPLLRSDLVGFGQGNVTRSISSEILVGLEALCIGMTLVMAMETDSDGDAVALGHSTVDCVARGSVQPMEVGLATPSDLCVQVESAMADCS